MKQKKNIVWFCTDQQRYDTIGALGNDRIRTPNLDRLIARGTAFTRAYTQAPICTPSRASFLTGRYPRTTRATFNGNDWFSKDETLVTKMFADNGYTCGLVGKLHLTAACGRLERRTDDGYSFFKWSHHPQDDWAEGIDSYQTWLRDKGVVWTEHYKGCHWDASNKVSDEQRKENQAYLKAIYEDGYKPFVGIEEQYHQTTWCVEEAMAFIEECGDNPWLISMNPFDPHHPIDPPPEYQARINAEDMKLPLWKDGELDNKPNLQRKDYVLGGMEGNGHSIIGMTDEHKREETRDYYAQIELIDAQLGRLMDFLDEKGLTNDTVIIFMSDHGELDGDHGVYLKGPYFYESLVHVPLVMSCPGTIAEGVKRNALVELVDIAPTLLDLCGMEIPFYMQGASLASLLTDPKHPDHHKDSVYCEFYDCLHHVAYKNHHATMYFDGRFKCVVHHGEDMGELYDLTTDPDEFDNLWFNPAYRDLKYDLVKKNFDQAILCNSDKVLNPIWRY